MTHRPLKIQMKSSKTSREFKLAASDSMTRIEKRGNHQQNFMLPIETNCASQNRIVCIWCRGSGVVRTGLHCSPCGGKGLTGGAL